MSDKRNIEIILQDIIDEINNIKTFTKGIKEYEDFSKNKLVVYAVMKSLENIGEAVKQIPEDIRNSYPFQWKKVAGLRDILIHQYFGIDLEAIWDVVINKLPKFELTIKDILNSQ